MKRADVILILSVLLIAGAALGARALLQKPVAYVTVYVASEVYARVRSDEYQSITVDQGDGRVNVVRIDAQGVCMESSTCKNQLCVKRGVIDPANADELVLSGWIICLPNGVSVELEGEK